MSPILIVLTGAHVAASLAFLTWLYVRDSRRQLTIAKSELKELQARSVRLDEHLNGLHRAIDVLGVKPGSGLRYHVASLRDVASAMLDDIPDYVEARPDFLRQIRALDDYLVHLGASASYLDSGNFQKLLEASNIPRSSRCYGKPWPAISDSLRLDPTVWEPAHPATDDVLDFVPTLDLLEQDLRSLDLLEQNFHVEPPLSGVADSPKCQASLT